MINPKQQELDILLNLMKQTKDKRMYERYLTIYLYLQGCAIKDIIRMVGRSSKTVYNYVNAYKDKGLDGLARRHSPGAPRKLSTEQEQELVQIIATQLPVHVGFHEKYNWTLAIIATLIERKWQQTYTLRGVSLLLHDLGLSYTKPTYTLTKVES